jgi:outer membrane immunogenic protein
MLMRIRAVCCDCTRRSGGNEEFCTDDASCCSTHHFTRLSLNRSDIAVTMPVFLLEVTVSRAVPVAGIVVAASLVGAFTALADGGATGTESTTYAGVRLGYGWLDTAARAGTPAEHGYDADGAIGSLVLGHDYASNGPWVIGAVLDLSIGNERGTAAEPGPVVFKVKQDWEASLRGRVGYRMEGVMPYATAGITYASFETQYRQLALPFISGDSQAVGWTIGAGVDVPVNDRWTAVAEYRYTDYGDNIDAMGTIDGPYDISSNQLYLGVNYRF